MPRLVRTPELYAEVCRRFSAGQSIRYIAHMTGLSAWSVYAWTHPEKEAARNERRKVREMMKRNGDLPRSYEIHNTVSWRRTMADRDAMKQKIPDDTRDLTARFFGDPLPGRSALDRRMR